LLEQLLVGDKIMNTQSIIKELEKEWDLDIGFMGGVRQGNFKLDRLERLESILMSAELASAENLERRFVSLTWYIPIFLIWQRERYIEQGRDVTELNQAINRIEGLLEKILGTP
jgi:hypothetical protein